MATEVVAGVVAETVLHLFSRIREQAACLTGNTIKGWSLKWLLKWIAITPLPLGSCRLLLIDSAWEQHISGTSIFLGSFMNSWYYYRVNSESVEETPGTYVNFSYPQYMPGTYV